MLSILFSALPVLFLQEDALPRRLPPKASIRLDPAVHEKKLLVLKLVEGSGVRLEYGRLEAPAATDLSGLASALGSRRVTPFFAGLETELARIRRRVLGMLPPGQSPPADLSLYFQVETKGEDDSRALLDALNALELVELAYPRQLPVPPPGDIPPVTPSFVSRQGYRGPAPLGIDAAAIRSLAGAWGSSTTVLDIEWGWWFDHEDIARLRPASLKGPAIYNPSYNKHGTAVMGVMGGDADRFGVSGLTPDARMLCVTNYPRSGYSVSRAIVTGLPYLKKGDVMLLEAQAYTPRGLGPTEYVQADFDAIQNATRAGVIVVEAAGNGGANLDDPVMQRRFDLTYRDSGAIIVAATAGSSLVRASFSSYGSRIDANGWGGSVTTTGYGALFNPGGDRRQRYTSGFGGTSSASPMVTSAVIALVAAAKAQWSPARAATMDYKRVRALLRTYGTKPTNSIDLKRISLRPDLAALLKGAKLERGLRVLNDIQIGKTADIEIRADFSASGSDYWFLIASAKPGNVATGLPAPCDRFLLGGFHILTMNTFTTNPVLLKLPVPNDAALKLGRLHAQVLTFRASTSRFCLTNSSMLFISD